MRKILTVGIIASCVILNVQFAGAQISNDIERLFDEAQMSFLNGGYQEAINIYDEILESSPEDTAALAMKGIAQSNAGLHRESLHQFYQIHQNDNSDVLALTGLGVGFGNLGEYQESRAYFEKALERDPENTIAQNYLNFVNSVMDRYPYLPTEKPDMLTQTKQPQIPDWIKHIAKWWALGQIGDSEFVDAIGFLLSNKIMSIPFNDGPNTQSSDSIPLWIKESSGQWANRQADDSNFVLGIHYMMKNGMLDVGIPVDAAQIEKENANKLAAFKNYLIKISKNISAEKRYIEYSNPSRDVIKKFLRDQIKWNFEQDAKSTAKKFPNPSHTIQDGTHKLLYKVFVNEQPSGLPLDHVSTLNKSFAFWEEQEISANGQRVEIKFEITNLKHEANVWVTWVVRDLGEGVLGHAHLGKGIVEVALGDYACDGSFQLYDIATVQKIMTHELGHSIGLQHVTDADNIMYPSMKPHYAYCLLG